MMLMLVNLLMANNKQTQTKIQKNTFHIMLKLPKQGIFFVHFSLTLERLRFQVPDAEISDSNELQHRLFPKNAIWNFCEPQKFTE